MNFRFICFFIVQSWMFGSQYIVSLGEKGSILYTYENNFLSKIDRLDSRNEIMYSHSYVYDMNGRLCAENLIGELGQVLYTERGDIQSSYYGEICKYNEKGQLIQRTQDGETCCYSYDDLGQLKNESINSDCEYDSQGNIIKLGALRFEYKNGFLTSVLSDDLEVGFEYDNFGKRIGKNVNGEKEHYTYLGKYEIAILDRNYNLKEVRIPGAFFQKGMFRAIAIETPDAIYAPLHDSQGNIIKIVNIQTREIISLPKPDPFGKFMNLNSPITWDFSGKHLDREINLVYFGERYYSPALGKWLTHDPAHQSEDPYLYCFNNPLKYYDPDGRTSEEAQKHYDNAQDELKEFLKDTVAATGCAIAEFWPGVCIEIWDASQHLIEAAKEYNEYVRLEAEEVQNSESQSAN